ncbi:MAG: phosphoserine phosphatase SerB [Rhodobacterales bacterium]|nr:phosphoserine phosphatase SerB [Rhodobacterales bacterium]
MFTATLLTSPEARNLEPALVENLRGAWGGGKAVWLSPMEAVEFDIVDQPDNQWDVWQDLQGMGIDLIVQRSEGRKKAILLADMDSTMIQQECIDELADEAGVGTYVAEITARAMNGELDFDAALIERVGLMKGLDVAVIKKVLAQRITLMPGAKPLLGTMKAAGGYCALVSGGFTAFTAQVARQLGFDENRANELVIDNQKLSGDVIRPILGREAKVDALNEITKRRGLTANDVLAVGDGANDLGMLGIAGTGVALHAKPSVAAQCDVRINHGDLTALLFLQGYKRDQFISAPNEAA